jgi:hypothetical protein
MKKWNVIFFTLVSVVGFSTGAAQAQDDTYAGVGCQVDDDATTAFDRLQGLLQNLDSSPHNVFCPIIRAESGVGISEMRVSVVDNSANQNVSCLLIAREKDGTNVGSQEVSSDPALPAAQDLVFAALVAPAGGYFTLRCSVPAVRTAGSSAIASYRVKQ